MWSYKLSVEAKEDYRKLDGSQKKYALALLKKLEENPLPRLKGGYGHPLGNDDQTGNLTGYFKLKARGCGIRLVYKLIEQDCMSHVIVIGMREDKDVYKIASKRINQKSRK